MHRGSRKPVFFTESYQIYRIVLDLWPQSKIIVTLNYDFSSFRQVFSKANRIAVVTGAGVAAASGVPTFRGKHETWRKWKSQVTMSFSRHPSRVWEFFHYRRELVTGRKPTAAHYAIAECEARLRAQGRELVVITQCIDDLHLDAGSKHVLKIHANEGNS
uniref:Deacetylase sirtuin-type domain-containing protein n=1 Tax=Periophthalmus magnuspinnatus TaxID=409849 RepID=A0A3B4BCF2_9GOBI